MTRPVTLFTGQWADLPFEVVCEKAKRFGYDGLELACWGDHFDVERACSEDGYSRDRWDILNKYGLKCFAISNHLVGQAVCDQIDERHKGLLPARIWGDGSEDGVPPTGCRRDEEYCQGCSVIWSQSCAWVYRFFDMALYVFFSPQYP